MTAANPTFGRFPRSTSRRRRRLTPAGSAASVAVRPASCQRFRMRLPSSRALVTSMGSS